MTLSTDATWRLAVVRPAASRATHHCASAALRMLWLCSIPDDYHNGARKARLLPGVSF